MGNVNLDLSKSKAFVGVTYVCAAIGAIGGVHFAGAALGPLAAGAAGAVVGGLGLPAAVAGVALAGYVGFVGLKAAVSAAGKESVAVPLAAAVLAFSAAKAMFVTPFTAAGSLFKKLQPGQKKEEPASAPAAAPAAAAPAAEEKPSLFSKKGLKQFFAEKAAARQRPKPVYSSRKRHWWSPR